MTDTQFPRATRRPLILVVDDDPTLSQFVEVVLKAEGSVRSVSSGEAALELCSELHPDLILLDFELPGLGGLEVCQQLKTHDATRSIPVVFITAHHTPEVEDRCWEAGAVDFVVKPLHARTLANRVKAHLTLKAQADLLRELAFKDALTGIANRRYFHERIEAEVGRARRLGTPLSMLLVDVDHFKAFNDLYGHAAGDACLVQVAAALRSAIHRPTDIVARIGGEEFGCLLPDTALGNACTVAERLREAVASLGLPHEGSATADRVTISVGVAEIDLGGGQGIRGWLADADARLYRAKHLGRDQVCATLEPATGNG
ncbi:diguanylate cyclase [Pseudomarimonas salicorniae]|uniref:diguanylate cyclase n=1 Tax=Pseudomarimonas salicorniae TaxID=2933270 RepID=A0ABT0GKB1_9GAMM|nr:diguanylate cyclase [Lysobacter sp. CAU 1642]MCK7594995.1 diguanylate cyclase [Lysobacter sp. CAU 1642]